MNLKKQQFVSIAIYFCSLFTVDLFSFIHTVHYLLWLFGGSRQAVNTKLIYYHS